MSCPALPVPPAVSYFLVDLSTPVAGRLDDAKNTGGGDMIENLTAGGIMQNVAGNCQHIDAVSSSRFSSVIASVAPQWINP